MRGRQPGRKIQHPPGAWPESALVSGELPRQRAASPAAMTGEDRPYWRQIPISIDVLRLRAAADLAFCCWRYFSTKFVVAWK